MDTQKNYLVIAATAREIMPFLDHYRDTANNRIDGPGIDILITGIGLVATTYSLTRQLHTRRPDLIIQAGLAGSFDQAISLSSVVVVKQEAIADQSVLESGELKTVFDLGLARPNQFPFSKGCLPNKTAIIKKLKLQKVNAITVNEITTSKQKIGLYRQKFDPVIESMEGAALHYVGLMEKIPFIQLRSISNYIAERNKKNWELEKSIKNLNNELIRLLDHITKPNQPLNI